LKSEYLVLQKNLVYFETNLGYFLKNLVFFVTILISIVNVPAIEAGRSTATASAIDTPWRFR